VFCVAPFDRVSSRSDSTGRGEALAVIMDLVQPASWRTTETTFSRSVWETAERDRST